MMMMTCRNMKAMTIGLAGLTVTMLFGPGCTDTNMMAEAAARGSSARFDPESGALYRLYDYYPHQEVYRSVFDFTWHWREGAKWRSGATLPSTIQLNESTRVIVELPTSEPSKMHDEVIAMHPGIVHLQQQLAALEAQNANQPFANRETRSAFASAPTDQ